MKRKESLAQLTQAQRGAIEDAAQNSMGVVERRYGRGGFGGLAWERMMERLCDAGT